jgi:formate-dependent nitrite reductase membrane component NrfD
LHGSFRVLLSWLILFGNIIKAVAIVVAIVGLWSYPVKPLRTLAVALLASPYANSSIASKGPSHLGASILVSLLFLLISDQTGVNSMNEDLEVIGFGARFLGGDHMSGPVLEFLKG